METDTSSGQSGLLSFLPMLLICVGMAVVGHLLAREKGRPVAVWTVLGAIPFLNLLCLWYF